MVLKVRFVASRFAAVLVTCLDSVWVWSFTCRDVLPVASSLLVTQPIAVVYLSAANPIRNPTTHPGILPPVQPKQTSAFRMQIRS